ncbi:MAG: iron ABC transporter permease [Planctomycetota bacterium]
MLARVTAESEGVWEHLVETVLADYLLNTLGLLVGVLVGTTVIGVAAAWIVTMYTFPGRRVLSWMLLLPLAMPTYLMAYTYTDLLQFSGPVQTWLRESCGWSRGDYWFPEIRSLGGAVATFSLVLYPYVYMLARVAFLEQSQCVLEVSRTLGRGPWRSFFSVALPLARPGIAAGASLALMETLAEYGAVDYFAVDTFTTGIYRTWTALASPEAASQLAAVLVLFVLVLLSLERLGRGKARYDPTTNRHRAARSPRLAGWRGAAAATACAVPVIGGFGLPAAVLFRLARGADHTLGSNDVLTLVRNTLTLALVTAALVALLGLILAYGARIDRGRWVRFGARIVSLGYAVPGSVVAVGVLVTLSGLTRLTGLFAGGTIAALVYAYSVRFSAVSVQTLEAGLQKVAPTMDEAARTLGATPGGVLRRIHAPLLRGSILTASLLVFVDVMKELPATMIMRPFDFDTLAVRVHHYASDERLAQSAFPALLIVAVGLGPVILLSRAIDRARTGDQLAP